MSPSKTVVRESMEKALFGKSTKSKAVERLVFALFRLGTYFVLLCAATIFADIVYKGGKTVFRSEFPFLNVEFLSDSPQTLHVFEYQGRKYEMSDSNFRSFREGIDEPIVTETYAYSGGGIWPCIAPEEGAEYTWRKQISTRLPAPSSQRA